MSLRNRLLYSIVFMVTAFAMSGCGSSNSNDTDDTASDPGTTLNGDVVFEATTEPPALFRIASTTEDLSVRINQVATNGAAIDVVVYESGNSVYFLQTDEEEGKRLLILADQICSMQNAYRLDEGERAIVEKLEIVLELNETDCSLEQRKFSTFRKVSFNQFGANVEVSESSSVTGSSTWFIDIDEEEGIAVAGSIKFDEDDQVLRLLDEELTVVWEYEFEITTLDFEAYYVNDRLTVLRQNENVFVRPPSTVLAARSEQDVFALLAEPTLVLDNYIPDSALLCWSSNGENIVIKDGQDFYQYNETTGEFDLYITIDAVSPNSCDFSLIADGTLLVIQDDSEAFGATVFSLMAYNPITDTERLLIRDQNVSYRIVEDGVYVNSSNENQIVSAHYLDQNLVIRSFENSKWMHIEDERTDRSVPLLITSEEITDELLLRSPTVNVFDIDEANGKGFFIGQVDEAITLQNSSGVIATSQFGVLNFGLSPDSPETISYSFDPRSENSANKL